MIERTVIGGRAFDLLKSEVEFNVLESDPALIGPVERTPHVEMVEQAAHGLWKVRVTSPDELDWVMDEVRRSVVAHHRYKVLGDELNSELTITDLINVKLRHPADLQAICTAFGLHFVRRYPGEVYACRVTAEANENPLKVLRRLNGDSRVSFAEPDFLMGIERFAGLGPSASEYPEQWHLHGTCRRLNLDRLANVRVADAWRTTTGDTSVVVALMDDGFDVPNADLEDRLVWPSDFTRRDVTAPLLPDSGPDDQHPLPDANRGDFHGTPCAGLAIGRGRMRVSGVAPGCSWMPVRFNMGASSQSLLLSILDFVSSRADVVSCSWGLKPSAYLQFSETAAQVVSSLTRTGGRRGKGLVLCFAAGNHNLPTFLKAEDNTRGLEYYGEKGDVLGRFFRNKEIRSGWTEVPGVVVVSAITARKRKALYSNWGPHITVCAPSDNWHPRHVSTRPQYDSINLTTTENEKHGLGLMDIGLSVEDLGEFTHDMGGTSGAAPIVAGACALMLSVDPNLTSVEVVDILRRSSNKEVDPMLDERGMHNNVGQSPDFDAHGHSPWFGHGLLDVARAIEMVLTKMEE